VNRGGQETGFMVSIIDIIASVETERRSRTSLYDTPNVRQEARRAFFQYSVYK